MSSLLGLIGQVFTPDRRKMLLRLVVAAALYKLFMEKVYWPMRLKSFKGKLVLITGGAGGVGRELALRFARIGAKICLWDLNAEALKRTAEEIRNETKADVKYAVCDITDRHRVYAMAEDVRREFGEDVYCLVNNAGIVGGKFLLESKDERIIKLMQVNTMAHFWTIKAFLPAMIRNNSGHVICVASAAAFFGSPRMVDYNASKFAARGLNEGLRSELTKLGVTGVDTTCVCPGHITTGLFKGFDMGFLFPSMSPGFVAEQIVKAARRRYLLVCLPAYVRLGVFVQGVVPTWLNDVFMLLQQGGMDKFQSGKADTAFNKMGR